MYTFDKGHVTWVHSDDKIDNILYSACTARDMEFLQLIIQEYLPTDLIISNNKFGKRTFFADNWPDRGRNWLPCIDHPYEKATVDFIVTAPDHYKVVGSGYLIEESYMPGHTKLTHWKEEVPLPVKVMAIGAARFATRFEGNVDGIPVWSWVFS